MGVGGLSTWNWRLLDWIPCSHLPHLHAPIPNPDPVDIAFGRLFVSVQLQARRKVLLFHGSDQQAVLIFLLLPFSSLPLPLYST